MYKPKMSQKLADRGIQSAKNRSSQRGLYWLESIPPIGKLLSLFRYLQLPLERWSFALAREVSLCPNRPSPSFSIVSWAGSDTNLSPQAKAKPPTHKCHQYRLIFIPLFILLCAQVNAREGQKPIFESYSEDSSTGANTKDASSKTVLLAILARNKEHTLPTFLRCIERQDYDKQLITVYIHTNDNEDNTAQFLHSWAEKWKEAYRNIIFIEDGYGLPQQNPHDWDAARFHVLGSIRNNSINLALENNCDYYFVVDCDNFIIPETLKTLVEKNLPIVAPMLRAIPEASDYYSNFFCAVDEYGYYQHHSDYYPLVSRSIQGTFNVPVVHCTYLVRSDVIPKLGYIDGTDDYEFVIFSRLARQSGIGQYLCNEKEFGFLLHFFSNLTLEQEKNAYEDFLESSRAVSNLSFLQ